MKRLYRPCVMVLLMLLAASSIRAQSNYYIPTVNYNELNHLRYSFANSIDGTNFKNRGISGTNYNADSYLNARAQWSSDRGWVMRFEQADGKSRGGGYVKHVYPRIGSSDKASLSLWLRPTTGTDDAFIMARGEEARGFSILLWKKTLVFTSWDNHVISFVESDSGMLRAGDWNHIAVTQSSAVEGNYYVALYINNKLAGDGWVKVPGLAPLSETNGYIGSAAKAGWIAAGNQVALYERDLSDADLLAFDVAPFFMGDIGDVRYFATEELVCSDKTQSSYAATNHEIELGSTCDLRSDIASLATDRIEPAGLISYFPYRRDINDHGPSQTIVSDENTAAPYYRPDDLRLDKAEFIRGIEYNYVSYGDESSNDAAKPGNLINTHVKGPFALSFWMQRAGYPDDPNIQMLYKAGSENEGGINVYLQAGQLYFGAWNDNGKKYFIPVSDRALITDSSWHHIAVSYDPARLGASNPTPYALEAFIDGQWVGASEMKAVNGRGGKFTTIGAKGPNSTRYYEGTKDKYKKGDNAFSGNLSELRVYAFPLSLPQVRQLASHYPAAYEPIIRSDYYGTQSSSSPVDGYVYIASTPSKSNPGYQSNYQYDSLSIKLRYSWDSAPSRWIDTFSRQPTGDCEYVIGGVALQENPGWQAPEPTAAYLCFSPAKISNGMAPFTLGLEYRAYAQTLYMPIFDALMPPAVLRELLKFGSETIHDITTDFDLNIGKYNIILQAKTDAPLLYEREPNYIGPLFVGASKLVQTVFTDATSKQMPIYIVIPTNALSKSATYVDQKTLLDELDVKFSKLR